MKDFSLVLRRWLPVLAWFVLVMAASTGIASSGVTGAFVDLVREWLGWPRGTSSATDTNFFVRKAAHFLQFFVFALLFWRGLRLRPALLPSVAGTAAVVLGGSVVGAFLSEYVQMFFPNRNPALADVGLDVAGAAFAVAIACVFARWSGDGGVRTVRGSFHRLLVTPTLQPGGFPEASWRALAGRLADPGGVVVLVSAAAGISRAEVSRLRRRIPHSVPIVLTAPHPMRGVTPLTRRGIVRLGRVALLLLDEGCLPADPDAAWELARAREIRALLGEVPSDVTHVVALNLHAPPKGDNQSHDACWFRLLPVCRDALRPLAKTGLRVVDEVGCHHVREEGPEGLVVENLVVPREAGGFLEIPFERLDGHP